MDWFLGQKLEISSWVFLGALVYMIGHIIAWPAKFLLENLLVKRILKPPSVNLFASERKWLHWILYEYYTPLVKETCARVLEKATKEGVGMAGEALFQLAFAEVKSSEGTMARLSSFRNQYGFHRNVGFSFLVFGIAGLVGKFLADQKIEGWWIGLAFFLGAGLTMRFLKYFRQYSYEVFVTYSRTGGTNNEGQNGV